MWSNIYGVQYLGSMRVISTVTPSDHFPMLLESTLNTDKPNDTVESADRLENIINWRSVNEMKFVNEMTMSD